MKLSDQLVAEIAKEGTTRRKLTEALLSRGLNPCDSWLQMTIKRIQDPKSFESMDRMAAEIAAEGTTRQKLTEALMSRGFSACDPVMRGAIKRIKIINRIQTLQMERQVGAKLLALPIAIEWLPQARAAIEGAKVFETAHEIAVSASLETVARLATTKWGFIHRHGSKSGRGFGSQYLLLPGFGMVRVSNHILPINDERAKRYAREGAPPWGEILVGDPELGWSLDQWREQLMGQAWVAFQLNLEAKALARKSKPRTDRERTRPRSLRDEFDGEEQKWVSMMDARQRKEWAA